MECEYAAAAQKTYPIMIIFLEFEFHVCFGGGKTSVQCDLIDLKLVNLGFCTLIHETLKHIDTSTRKTSTHAVIEIIQNLQLQSNVRCATKIEDVSSLTLKFQYIETFRPRRTSSIYCNTN